MPATDSGGFNDQRQDHVPASRHGITERRAGLRIVTHLAEGDIDCDRCRLCLLYPSRCVSETGR